MLGRSIRAFVALCLPFSQIAHAEVGGNWMGGGRNSLLYGYAQPVPASSCTWTTSGLIIDINPADTSKLWQTITSTTAVTADGDVVGTAEDTSGAGFHLTATGNDTTRPLYKTSGGLSWLQFDGSNDLLRRVANLGLYSSGAMTLEIALRETTTQQASYVAEGLSSDSNPYTDFARHSNASPANWGVTSRNNDGSFEYNGVNFWTNGITLNVDQVLITTMTTTNYTGYVDGVSGGNFSHTRGTHTSPDTFTLGARIRATTDAWAAARIYRLRAFNRVLNSTEIANDNTCLKATQGR